jgi:hypothetical protein
MFDEMLTVDMRTLEFTRTRGHVAVCPHASVVQPSRPQPSRIEAA